MRFFVTTLVIALLIVLGVVIFRPKSKTPTTGTTSSAKNLYDLSTTDAEVSMTIDGQVNGDDVHRQVVITVNKDTRRIDIVQGYQGNVIKTKSYANNTDAYNVFLHALYHAGYTKAAKDTSLDEKGVCSIGRTYIYQTVNADSLDERLWSTDCGSAKKTFLGNATLVQQLFKQQITDYDSLTGNINL